MADVDVARLGELARLELSSEEVQKLEQEVGGILAYVSQLGNVRTTEGVADLWGRTNVWRTDGTPHEAGIYTKDLLAAAPAVERGRVAVKKIL